MIDREALIDAIDELHMGAVEHHWAEAQRLATALGWPEFSGDIPDGQWIRARLNEALR